ncbi:aminopeptidase [Lactobacillus johnsonii]|jgi:bleomycin hydrolase|uniref:C1 family peptidase n=1 Tax=Lactobacillus johnsonii TaxID=33959 RepID=UPI0010721C0D|nr:C1 family peptidase [Lactobacillus johnsonii]MBF0770710.1 C1 family peptidase [Lactobacillus johnsonii]MCF1582575.1 C1 family peptidase [Lactobacillus johnsonii]MCI9450815.1 C1 family peptidase [Lactobacillus johnsonii]MDG4988809.1 C1 family peptidase [Lactobacillus johnsonii]NDO43674.1 C1 family peptidase [Lactobacillus johnsonii]
MTHELTLDEIAKFQQDYQQNKQNKIAELAVVNNGVQKASFNGEGIRDLNRTFSIEIPTDNVTDQKQSGRCWLFAALNVLRHKFAKQYHTKNFTFSQSYLFFWDRIERANIFFNHILETADKPVDDRTVHFYLQAPDTDGGQWHMAISLIRKYGLVPTYAQDESFTANNTAAFNQALNMKLREDGLVLRKLAQAGKNDEIEQKRQEYLSEIYRMAVIAFGQPVQKFDLEFKDDDGNYKLDQNITPLDFFHNYFEDDLDDYVVLFNAPDHEYDKLYAFPFEDNVEGGSPVRFLNTKIENLKEAAIKQLKDGETIWFGCDVGKQSDRQKGILAADLYETDTIFGIETKLNKKERLQTGASGSTHAMTFVGVDVVDGKPRQWKVENSWGTKVGDKGYFVMDDKWFDEYLFKVVVKKQYLPEKLVKIAESEATPVPCWDSMA